MEPDYLAKLFSMWMGLHCRSEYIKPVMDIADSMLQHWSRYEAVGKEVGVPPFVVACLHFRESSLDFTKHLSNGDPLTARTLHVPAGRPMMGNPPFTWEESASDILSYMGLGRIKSWSIAQILFQLEKWNGLAYKKNGLNSPYLWSWSNYETPGLYVADHKFDPNRVEARPGCALLLAALKQKGVDLGDLVQNKLGGK